MTTPWHSAAVTDVAFHSTHRKGYQSKLLFFHSKGGRCSFWGLLYCDDRRSPWWASRDELQHDHIRSDTVMIRMNFNSYASLVIFFIISVLFCFVFELWTFYTIRVLAVFDFLFKSSNIVQLADGVTAVAQLYALYSHRARSFNQWQHALYPNFIIN